MILLPLYFQIVRGDSVVRTGLLLVPQSLGAAVRDAVRRAAGRPLRRRPDRARRGDRLGGLDAAARIRHGRRRRYGLIEASLLVRGLGIGLAMMPAMSAAYAVLRPEQIADATPQLTVVQRVGGSIGTAVLAVALGTALTGATGPAGTSAAFASAYWWAFGLSVVAIDPGVILLQAERHSRRFQSEQRSRAATEAALEAA